MCRNDRLLPYDRAWELSGGQSRLRAHIERKFLSLSKPEKYVTGLKRGINDVEMVVFYIPTVLRRSMYRSRFWTIYAILE